MERKLYSVKYVNELKAKAKKKYDLPNQERELAKVTIEALLEFIEDQGLDDKLGEFFEQCETVKAIVNEMDV